MRGRRGRTAAVLLALLAVSAAAAGCGDDAAPPRAAPPPGPQAWMLLERPEGEPRTVAGPHASALPPDRVSDGASVWRLTTLYGNRHRVAGAGLVAEQRDGARVEFVPVPATPDGAETVLLRDATGTWLVRDDPHVAGSPVARDVVALWLRIPPGAEEPAHGSGGRRGQGGGRGAGRGDGSGGGRGAR